MSNMREPDCWLPTRHAGFLFFGTQGAKEKWRERKREGETEADIMGKSREAVMEKHIFHNVI